MHEPIHSEGYRSATPLGDSTRGSTENGFMKAVPGTFFFFKLKNVSCEYDRVNG